MSALAFPAGEKHLRARFAHVLLAAGAAGAAAAAVVSIQFHTSRRKAVYRWRMTTLVDDGRWCVCVCVLRENGTALFTTIRKYD